MRPAGPRRQVLHTVLLVGEGDSEVVWLHHLKAIYTSAQLKQEFSARFGASAADAKVYERYFSAAFLEAARSRSHALTQLLNLFIK